MRSSTPRPAARLGRLWRSALTAVALPVLAAAGPGHVTPPSATAPLRAAVSADGVFVHLQALQAIADRNGGNRAAGSPGYDRSAEYVADRLRDAGYAVKIQDFDFPYFEELADPVLSVRAAGSEAPPAVGTVRTLAYSGGGAVEGPLLPVDLGMIPGERPAKSTSGCEAADFSSFRSGAIALIRRGTCRFQTKVDNAAAAGAVGVVILNEGIGDAVGSFRGKLAKPAGIPVVGVDYATGERLLAATRAGAVEAHLAVQARSGRRSTRNVIAETTLGDPDRILLVGAHLDSVPAGPGINDNGSGAAVVLETALQLAKLAVVPRNRVRFAFWGAEELGLLGSRHYVDSLAAAEQAGIFAVLNFDMLGSPNYGRFVYDGDGSQARRAHAAPKGSGEIEQVFLRYFAARGIATAPTPVNASSDHSPFASRGIPVGGLYTGSAERKTGAYAALFGGRAGRRYDPCYHRACDTIGNVSRRAIDEMSDAAAHAVLALALEPVAGS